MRRRTPRQRFLLNDDIRRIARKCVKDVYVPSSVYRLQFNREFNFKKASELIPYLSKLGIDAVYCSPYFEALPNSDHGYDIVNPNRINPEVGSLEDYEGFCEVLRKHGMRQIADVVPNHMGIMGGKNDWWMDVLENGRNSVYSEFFDIAWEPEKKELRNKVLIPILSDYFGKVLENGDLKLEFDSDTGSYFIRYWENRLPINPESYPHILEAGITEFSEDFEEDQRDYLELLSVITAFRNLPTDVSGNRLKLLERNREKEIAKERLAGLCEYSKRIAQYLKEKEVFFNGKAGNPGSFDRLQTLLDRQTFRLSFWQVAAEEINYRRFFDVNALAALRVENPSAFHRYHSLLFHLMEDGKISGLRIDHTDGLYDPRGYLRKIQRTHLLRRVFREAYQQDPGQFQDQPTSRKMMDRIKVVLEEDEFVSAPSVFVAVEKILGRRETLPEDWPVHGTVGYEFLNLLNGIFVKQDSVAELEKIYRDFTGLSAEVEDLIYQKKKFFALVHMASEINALAHRLDSISEASRHYRDFTLNNLKLAIRESIACFPVYRTYLAPEDRVVSDRDEKYIHIAVERAKQRTPDLRPAVYNFLKEVLTLNFRSRLDERERFAYQDFVLRFQQITGPVMAKGMEDTLYYVYNRLISLNEVGADPERFGVSVAEFHKFNADNLVGARKGFLTASTHDTKRSEDARLRINYLSEVPSDWKNAVARWAVLNKDQKTLIGEAPAPEPNMEYFIYQTLIGMWPNTTLNDADYNGFVERVWKVTIKSAKEAKVRTSWVRPDEAYEKALKKFVHQILNRERKNAFLDEFLPFVNVVSDAGVLGGISATVLRAASPGILDLYQGSEVWEYRMVDPDNRGLVDYRSRKEHLEAVMREEPKRRSAVYLKELFESREDGRIKLYLYRKLLHLRRQYPVLFTQSEYRPLQTQGGAAHNIVAFIRGKGTQTALVAGGRLFSDMKKSSRDGKITKEMWVGTYVILPGQLKNSKWTDVFSGKTLKPEKIKESKREVWGLPAASLFDGMTAALLIETGKER